MGVFARDDLPFPRSLPEFQYLFPDEAACAGYLERVRWSDGFICSSCGVSDAPRYVSTRPGVPRCTNAYVAYPLSLRHLEEMMAERGVAVDYSTIHRWAMKMLPVLAAVCRRRKRSIGLSWRMDETYVKISGQWKYLNNLFEQDHRAVKRITRPMLGFKTFRCARILIAGIEVMHMIRKGQLGAIKDRASSAENQFYSLAF